MITNTGKTPVLVFVHPCLLSQQYEYIDGMVVHYSQLIQSNQVVLSIQQELGLGLPDDDREIKYPIKPIWMDSDFIKF